MDSQSVWIQKHLAQLWLDAESWAMANTAAISVVRMLRWILKCRIFHEDMWVCDTLLKQVSQKHLRIILIIIKKKWFQEDSWKKSSSLASRKSLHGTAEAVGPVKLHLEWRTGSSHDAPGRELYESSLIWNRCHTWNRWSRWVWKSQSQLSCLRMTSSGLKITTYARRFLAV